MPSNKKDSKKHSLISTPLAQILTKSGCDKAKKKPKPQVRRTSILDDYFNRGFFANPDEGKKVNEGRFRTANTLQNLHYRATKVSRVSASYSLVGKLDKHCGARDEEGQIIKSIASQDYKYLQHLMSCLPHSLRWPIEVLVFEGKPPGKTGIDRVRVGLDLIERQMMRQK